jgi:hypothetical protein
MMEIYATNCKRSCISMCLAILFGSSMLKCLLVSILNRGLDTVIDYIWEKTPEGIAARQHTVITAKALAKAEKDRQGTADAVVKKILGTVEKAADWPGGIPCRPSPSEMAGCLHAAESKAQRVAANAT